MSCVLYNPDLKTPSPSLIRLVEDRKTDVFHVKRDQMLHCRKKRQRFTPILFIHLPNTIKLNLMLKEESCITHNFLVTAC